MYKKSKYNLFIRSKDGSYLCFNSMEGTLAKLDREGYKEVQTILRNPNNPKNFNDGMKQIFDSLSQGGFIRNRTVDELGILKMRSRRGRFIGDRVSLAILPTLDCNFKCSYCFESDFQKKGMDELLMEGVVNFVKNRLRDGVKLLNVSWYGGEPLMKLPLIKEFTTIFKKLCADSNIRYTAFITSNGYLLNKETVELLLPLGITGIQVTLDGPPVIHNQYRPLRNGGPTFDTVFKNFVGLVKSNVNLSLIRLRVNYNEKTVDRVAEILDLIPSEIRNRIDVYFRSIFRQVSDCSENKGNSIQYVNALFYKISVNLSRSAVEKGFKVSRISRFGKPFHCPSDYFDYFIIDPDGNIHKCDVAMNALPPVGKIERSGEFRLIESEMAKWMNREPVENINCKNCKALPQCMGGCALNSLMPKKRKCYMSDSGWLKEEVDLMYYKSMFSKEMVESSQVQI